MNYRFFFGSNYKQLDLFSDLFSLAFFFLVSVWFVVDVALKEKKRHASGSSCNSFEGSSWNRLIKLNLSFT